jgi:hypothetical protein
MWCVRTRDDGTFRAATAGPIDPYAGHVTVFSFDEWLRIDEPAARQFEAPPSSEDWLRRQQRFMGATGLGQRAALQRSMADAHARYGGS